MNPRFLAVALAFVLVVGACGGDSDESVSTAAGADGTATSDDGAASTGGDAQVDDDAAPSLPATFGDGEWVLVDGKVSDMPLRLLDSHQVTIVHADGEISGTAACNGYFGALTDGELLFDGFGVTEMACDPQAAMDLESTYLQALSTIDTAGRDGDDLVLRGDGVELRFQPVAATPDVDLEGTDWVLDTIVDGDTASSILAGTEPSIRFEEFAVSGSDGCNSFNSSYELIDGALSLGMVATTAVGCSDDVMNQAAAIGEVLGDQPTVSIDGDRLTLTRGDGSALIYRAV